jgi:beta-carotene 3-hydroxylase
MEVFSIVAHKYVMHGFGWAWHRSHHEPRTGWFEKNDLYALVFAGVAIALIYAGATLGHHPLEWIGAGMTAYGFCTSWPTTAWCTSAGPSATCRAAAT